MLLVLALAPLLLGSPQGEGAAVARRRAARHPALPRYLAAHAQGGRARRERLLALPRSALLIFAVTWVAAALVPTFAPAFCSWSADLIAMVALLGRRASPRAGRHGCRHQLRRHRCLARDDDRLARRARHAADRVHGRARRRHDPAFGHRQPVHAIRVGRPARLARPRAVRADVRRRSPRMPASRSTTRRRTWN